MPVSRQLALGVAAGLLSALLYLSLAKGVAFGLILSYLAPMPLMMAALALGRGAALVSGLTGIGAVASGTGPFMALAMALTAVLPALVVANRALLWRDNADGSREWYPPGLLLGWLTATGSVLLVGGTAWVALDGGEVRSVIGGSVARTVDQLLSQLPTDKRRDLAEWWTTTFPAMAICSWLIMSVVNAVAAQGILTRLGKARRPSPSYSKLWLPEWMAACLALAALGGMMDGDRGYVAMNVAIVLMVPFCCLGLAGIHRWAAGSSQARLILAATYGLLILAFGPAILGIAGLGLARFWTMRSRRTRRGGGMEE